MELLAAPPEDDHEVRLLQHRQVLGDRLPGHVQVGAELPERLPVVGVQPVKQQAACGVGEGLENLVMVVGHEDIMQPHGCMSRRAGAACTAGALKPSQGWGSHRTHTTSTPARVRAETVGSSGPASVTSTPTAPAAATRNGSAVPSFAREATAITRIERSTIAALLNDSS